MKVGRILSKLQRGFDAPLVIKVLTLAGYKGSDERFRNYCQSDPERPFCKTNIDPNCQCCGSITQLLFDEWGMRLNKDQGWGCGKP